jgi:hypothetical protein
MWDSRKLKTPLQSLGGLAALPTTGCCFSPDERLVLTGTEADRDGTGGSLVFVYREEWRVVRRLAMPSSVSAVLWHDRLNEIFVGVGAAAGFRVRGSMPPGRQLRQCCQRRNIEAICKELSSGQEDLCRLELYWRSAPAPALVTACLVFALEFGLIQLPIVSWQVHGIGTCLCWDLAHCCENRRRFSVPLGLLTMKELRPAALFQECIWCMRAFSRTDCCAGGRLAVSE